jgi:hypothetical protein
MPKAALGEFQDTPKSEPVKFPVDPAQRVAWLRHQIRQVTTGNVGSIVCPFCGSKVTLGLEKLCCEPMGETVATVLNRTEREKSSETDATTKGPAKLTVMPNRSAFNR